ENRRLAPADERLKEDRDALAADDVAQLARELFLALLLRVAHGISSGLHSRIHLTLEPDLRPVIDARRADEETDLSLLHLRETFADAVDEALAHLVRDRLERRVLHRVLPARVEEDVEARAADEVRCDDRARKSLVRFRGENLAGAAQELIEESPPVLGFDRFELLDVDEDDAHLSLLDEQLFQAIEQHRHGCESGRSIEEQVFDRAARAGRDDGLSVCATAVDEHADALQHFVAIERLDEVVVGADLQSGESIFDFAAAGDEDDANARRAL